MLQSLHTIPLPTGEGLGVGLSSSIVWEGLGVGLSFLFYLSSLVELQHV